jgi:hypothetical protein
MNKINVSMPVTIINFDTCCHIGVNILVYLATVSSAHNFFPLRFNFSLPYIKFDIISCSTV